MLCWFFCCGFCSMPSLFLSRPPLPSVASSPQPRPISQQQHLRQPRLFPPPRAICQPQRHRKFQPPSRVFLTQTTLSTAAMPFSQNFRASRSNVNNNHSILHPDPAVHQRRLRVFLAYKDVFTQISGRAHIQTRRRVENVLNSPLCRNIVCDTSELPVR